MFPAMSAPVRPRGEKFFYVLAAALALMTSGSDRGPLPVHAPELGKTVSTQIQVSTKESLLARSLVRLADGTAYIARFHQPMIRISPDGAISTYEMDAWAAVRDYHDNVYVRTVEPAQLMKIAPNGQITVLARAPREGSVASNKLFATTVNDDEACQYAIAYAEKLSVDSKGNVYALVGRLPRVWVCKITPAGRIRSHFKGTLSSRSNNFGTAFASDRSGNLFFGTLLSVTEVNGDGAISERVGHEPTSDADRTPSSPIQWHVRDVETDAHDNLYVTDGGGWAAGLVMYKVDHNGKISTVLQDRRLGPGMKYGLIDGPVSEQKFQPPSAYQVDDDGTIYFIDDANNAYRKLSADGVLQTLIRGPLPGGWAYN